MPTLMALNELDRHNFSKHLGFDAKALVMFDSSKYSVKEYGAFLREMLAWTAKCSGGAGSYTTPSMFIFEDPDEAMMFYLAFSHV